MELKGLVKQEEFVLTRDMVPIHFSGFKRDGVNFVCPLPRGFKKAIREHYKTIAREVARIIEEIHKKTLRKESPFENIMLGYQERTEEEQEELLQSFLIIDAKMREDVGVYSLYITHEGGPYLDQSTPNYYEFMTLEPLRELFEPHVAFHCHNVDWYWQALLTREFCVMYFNLLNRLIFQK